jgi:hypothetical protein
MSLQGKTCDAFGCFPLKNKWEFQTFIILKGLNLNMMV